MPASPSTGVSAGELGEPLGASAVSGPEQPGSAFVSVWSVRDDTVEDHEAVSRIGDELGAFERFGKPALLGEAMTQTPPGERSWVGNHDPFLGNRCKPVTERRQGAGGQYATQRLDGHALVVADHVGAREAQGEVDVLLTLGARGSRRECRSGPRRRSWLGDTTALELGACVDGHLPGAIRDRLLGWQIHDRAAERDELLGSCDAGGQRRDQVRRFGVGPGHERESNHRRTRSAPGPSASTA